MTLSWPIHAFIALAAAAALNGQPQETAQPKNFDVASVKITGHVSPNGESSTRSRIEFTPLSLRMINVTLRDCVEWAYRARFYEVTGPAVLDGDRYDIAAKTSDPVPQDELRRMLQALLRDRFRLVLHREVKRLNVFELTIDKNGSKLPPPKAADAPVHSVDSLPLVRDGSFIFPDASIAEFAAKLSLLRGVGVPVIDKTGIQGVYDIVLNGAASAIRQEDGPPIAEFVRELGLRMTPARDPVEVIVVDSAARPSRD